MISTFPGPRLDPSLSAAIIAAGRLALTPFVTHRTQKALGEMQGMHGSFSSVEVSVIHLAYRIHGLEIFSVEHAETGPKLTVLSSAPEGSRSVPPRRSKTCTGSCRSSSPSGSTGPRCGTASWSGWISR